MQTRGVLLLASLLLPKILFAAVGPTRAELNGVRYRKNTLSIDAKYASVSEGGLAFKYAHLRRYAPNGEIALDLKANSGSIKDSLVVLTEQVLVLWRGNGVEIELDTESLHWNTEQELLTSNSFVHGRVRPISNKQFLPIEFQGRGFIVNSKTGHIEIGSGVLLNALGDDGAPYKISADSGFSLIGLNTESPSLKMTGNVELTATGVKLNADDLNVSFAMEKGRAPVITSFLARNEISVIIDKRFKLLRQDFLPVEITGDLLECDMLQNKIKLFGNDKAASVINFSYGTLSGGNIVITPDEISSDGAAKSEFVYQNRTMTISGPINIKRMPEQEIAFNATRGVKICESKKRMVSARNLFCLFDSTREIKILRLLGDVKAKYDNSKISANGLTQTGSLTTLEAGDAKTVKLELGGMAISSVGNVIFDRTKNIIHFADFVNMSGNGFTLRSGLATVELEKTKSGFDFRRVMLKNGVRLNKDAIKNTSARSIRAISALYTPALNEVKFEGEPVAEYDNLEFKAPVIVLNLLTNLIETSGGKTSVQRKDQSE